MFNDPLSFLFDAYATYSHSLWILAAVGVYLTGVSKSGFAGSTGVIAVPLMSVLMDPRLAAALLLPLLLFMDALNVNFYWKSIEKVTFFALASGALLGLFLGSILFYWIDPDMLKVLIGSLSIGFALNQSLLRSHQKKPKNPTVKLAPLLGTLAGFTSFIAHAGGAPLTAFFLRSELNKETILATSAVTIGFMNLIKLPVYTFVGVFDHQVIAFSIILMPLAWLGIKTGQSIKNRVSEKLFIRVMTYSLFVLGIYLVYSGMQ